MPEWFTKELILGIIGTITGISALLFQLYIKLVRENPILKVSDALLFLEKENDKVKGSLSFNVDNLGDRSTTVTRVNVILGDHVEVIERLRTVSPHSSIRFPEKKDFSIKLFTQYKEIENLRIIVIHTHGTLEKIFRLPQVSEWEKHALWKGGPIVLMP
jgi:hypothetical protein